jgi:hypothetical protein
VSVGLVSEGIKRRGAHVSEGEERAVKEEHDAEQHEEHAERGQPDADFCAFIAVPTV